MSDPTWGEFVWRMEETSEAARSEENHQEMGQASLKGVAREESSDDDSFDPDYNPDTDSDEAREAAADLAGTDDEDEEVRQDSEEDGEVEHEQDSEEDGEVEQEQESAEDDEVEQDSADGLVEAMGGLDLSGKGC
ncbi:hypothetical protein D9Q98_007004 [Chlorella vulgaris]|uniref:Uncharacterized protein n=1 Tax=Chlorella vulgaris TaxID=3077 RepID=A0A9D4TJF8_CHLVU|nr:hypothetical protein D9Q98_007004 [Chlorella vulgaris]